MPYRAKGVDLELILNSISDGISVHDLDWKYTYANLQIAEFVGLPLEKLIGKSLLDLSPDFALSEIGKLCERVKSTGVHETAAIKNPYTSSTDPRTDKWYQFDLYPTSDAITLIARDVTERYKVELKVKGALEQLDLITNAVPVLISYVDRDYKYQYANKGYERWFNVKSEEMIGTRVVDMIGETAFNDVKPSFEEAFLGKRVSFERQLRYRTDFVKWVKVHYEPDVAEDGTVRGCVVLLEDRDEQHALELSRTQSEDRLRLALRNLPVILSHTDLDLRYTWVANPLDEYAGADLIGKTASEVMPEPTALLVDNAKRKAMSTKQPTQVEFSTTLGGVSKIFDLHVEPRFDAEGTLIGTTTAAMDVTSWRTNESRLQMLSRVSEKLASSLTDPSILQSVAELAVESFSDFCTISEPGEAGSMIVLASAWNDPSREVQFRKLVDHISTGPQSAGARALREGAPYFLPYVTDEVINTASDDPEEIKIAFDADLRSVISVPMESRGEMIGAITFALTSGKKYKEEDVEFARMLGRRVAAAVDNARLYRSALAEIEDRKRVEQELNERDEQLARLMSNVPGMAFRCLTEAGWPFEYASPGCYELTGYHPSDFHVSGSKRWSGLINPEDLPEIDRVVTNAIAQNIPIEVTYRIRHSNGSERYILDRSVAVRDENDNVIAFEGICIDITEIRKAQEAIMQANQAKDQFIAALSHELRTPLTPVLTCIEVLKDDGRLPKDLHPMIDIIERNINLEARLIDDLLDLTRIIRGKVHLEKKTMDLHSLVYNAMDICVGKVKEKNLSITLELDAKHATVHCDPARMQQVLWNLLQNAAKFTPTDGSITIKTWNSAQDELYISIQDTGIGMEPAQLDRIFNPFEQGTPTITKRYGGLGLGLAISHRIVELHSGKIEAFSEGDGQGSTFTVTLPVAVSESISSSYSISAK